MASRQRHWQDRFSVTQSMTLTWPQVQMHRWQAELFKISKSVRWPDFCPKTEFYPFYLCPDNEISLRNFCPLSYLNLRLFLSSSLKAVCRVAFSLLFSNLLFNIFQKRESPSRPRILQLIGLWEQLWLKWKRIGCLFSLIVSIISTGTVQYI